jgi:hypothetical protein
MLKILILLSLLSLSAAAQTPKSKKHHNPTWVTGTWEGTGYQTDDKSTWTMLLRAHSGKYSISYPSLKCGGKWVVRRLQKNRALFTERLSYGQEQCQNNGRVTIQRLNKKQLMFIYRNPGEREVTASAVLNRAMEGDPLIETIKSTEQGRLLLPARLKLGNNLLR